MSLTGKLGTMGLPEVLQWIASSRKTGTLFLRQPPIEKRIVFKDGAVYSSWSNHPRESLGQFLIRDRRVTEEQLFRALLRQEQEGKLLGALLVEEGVLSAEDLRRALQTKAEETVYDLFLWPDGDFDFQDGEASERFHRELPVTQVIMEGIRRVDEWQRIRAVFPSLDVTFRVRPGAAPGDPSEVHALALARAGKPLAEIALEMRRSEFDAASVLFSLQQQGLLEVDEVRAAIPAAASVKAIGELLSTASQHMSEGRYPSALAAYEDVLRIDRLNHHARKGAAAAREALQRERSAAVALDKVPVLVMGLSRLTSEPLAPQEGFVLSRVNGVWDVRSILKICPLAEREALDIFARLLERKVIELR